MGMKDAEIQKKLVELESAILKESGPADNAQVSRVETASELNRVTPSKNQFSNNKVSESQKSDLHYFGGIFLIVIGIIMLFQHVRVTTGMVGYWGMSTGSSIGGLIVLLLIGLGWLVYNSKSIWGWLISAVSVFSLIFTIISGLRIFFVPITMFNLIFMMLPLAIGGAFLLKGVGGPKGAAEIIRARIERNE